MKWTDYREIARWTIITTVVVVCIGGVQMAICALDTLQQLGQANITVQGCELTARVEQIDGTNDVRVKIHATNPGDQPQKLDANVSLVRRVFAGNPASRVLSANDYKETLESVVPLDGRVPALGSADFEVTMSMDGSVEDVSALPTDQPAARNTASIAIKDGLAISADPGTYQVNIEQGGIKQPLVSFVRKQPGQ